MPLFLPFCESRFSLPPLVISACFFTEALKTTSCLRRDENTRELNYKKNPIHQLFLHCPPLRIMPLRARFRKVLALQRSFVCYCFNNNI